VEVDPAPAFKERFPDARAYRIREVQIIVEPEGESWHVSVSHPERFPTWEELRTAAGLATGTDAMWVYMPLSGGASPVESNVVHLYEVPPVAS